MAKASVPQASCVARGGARANEEGVEGWGYLLAGVLSIKLWFMQIMRVQKLV